MILRILAVILLVLAALCIVGIAYMVRSGTGSVQACAALAFFGLISLVGGALLSALASILRALEDNQISSLRR